LRKNLDQKPHSCEKATGPILFVINAMYHRCRDFYCTLLSCFAVLTTSTVCSHAQTTLTNGLTQQGTLSSPTDAQTWMVQAQAGDRICLMVAKLSGGAAFNPRVEVTSPMGGFLGAASGITAARLDLQADVSGIYTVTVTDAQQTGNGNYQIQLHRF
jgi:hypothetical protein